jgi:hypothetical protein
MRGDEAGAAASDRSAGGGAAADGNSSARDPEPEVTLLTSAAVAPGQAADLGLGVPP